MNHELAEMVVVAVEDFAVAVVVAVADYYMMYY